MLFPNFMDINTFLYLFMFVEVYLLHTTNNFFYSSASSCRRKSTPPRCKTQLDSGKFVFALFEDWTQPGGSGHGGQGDKKDDDWMLVYNAEHDWSTCWDVDHHYSQDNWKTCAFFLLIFKFSLEYFTLMWLCFIFLFLWQFLGFSLRLIVCVLTVILICQHFCKSKIILVVLRFWKYFFNYCKCVN